MSLIASFVLGASGGPDGLFKMLRAVMTDRWVASCQVGFGPPLVRSSPELVEELASARSAFDKLSIYLRRCLFDDAVCEELLRRHRRMMVRRGGLVEAEAFDAASEDVWDLSLRLHRPTEAPPDVQASMKANGVVSLDVPPSTPPEALTGRFRLHLHDPRGTRLLDIPVVAAATAEIAAPTPIELRVSTSFLWVWQRWLVDLETRLPHVPVVDIGEPPSHARVLRNGHRC